ncbi:hypothetical protein [Alkalicoccus halolimnae]|uniref:Excalibur calcium-binding domain-containing protein n=1 Tax=Alkalicoccus halolimnae TaxID=1667239 RepID=A0A5C7FED1_9BACI|nr:hypothetical protein [Alkalicoccus halolimnae]TXF83921.1 hypothetical protein FTX54_11565 [Alkalicoccus halolimnae]
MLKKWIVSMTSVAIIGFGGMTSVHADHEEGTINCGDLETGDDVWEFWEEHGYSSENDPEGLDGDSDGLPCEGKTGDMADQFYTYDDEQTGNDVENNNNENNNGNNTEEEAANENNNNNNANNNYNNNNENNNNHNNVNNHNNDNNNANEAAASDNNHEGNEMADTSTTYPMMALFGVIAVGAGAFMLFGRKTSQA